MNLGFLQPLYDLPGPFASAYLDTSWDTEDAAHAVALRWRAERAELAKQGADAATLDAMEKLLTASPAAPGEHGHVVFAADGRVVYEHLLPEAPRRHSARWSGLPHAMPLVMQLAEQLPYVVVIADRVGADIRAVGPNGSTPRKLSVDGDKLGITKHAAGGYSGWSQRHWQQRAENTWEQNAKRVAEQVDELVVSTGARVLAVAGEVRARAALRDHLGKRSLAILSEIETAARSQGAKEEPVTRKVQALLREAVTADRLSELARYEREREHHDRAVEGLKAVSDALRRAQVETVVLRDDPTSTAMLWIGPGPTELAVDPNQLADLGVSALVEERADAAIVRALTTTGGGLLSVPEEISSERLPLADGIGALLRYADAATTA